MIVTALIIRAAATTVEFFATEAQALAAVKTYLEDYGLDAADAEAMTAADVSEWINNKGEEFEFTFEAVSAPAYRVTVTDRTTEVTLVDRLLHTITLEGAREALGSAWNQYGRDGLNREAILWSTGQDEPVERITATN